MVWWVAVAGAVGALARLGVHTAVQSRTASKFPNGTVVVNLSGSFVLGLIAGFATYQGLDADVHIVVGTGFLGAYTTFASYSYDTLGLAESGETRAAVVNALGSVAAGLLAAAAGFVLAGLF